jgi:hypothetical protein
MTIKKIFEKIKKHVKHRLKRAKTYVALLMTGLVTAQPYLISTPFADKINYVIAACALFTALSGKGLPENDNINIDKLN